MVVRWRLLVEGMSCVAMDGRIWLTEGFLQLRWCWTMESVPEWE